MSDPLAETDAAPGLTLPRWRYGKPDLFLMLRRFLAGYVDYQGLHYLLWLIYRILFAAHLLPKVAWIYNYHFLVEVGFALYFILCWRLRRATLGMWMMMLRIADDHGGRPSWKEAAKTYLVLSFVFLLGWRANNIIVASGIPLPPGSEMGVVKMIAFVKILVFSSVMAPLFVTKSRKNLANLYGGTVIEPRERPE